MINQIKTNLMPGQRFSLNNAQPSTMTEAKILEETKVDTVIIGKNAAKTNTTYQKPAVTKPDVQEIDKLWKQAEKASASLRNLVERLIARQGQNINDILAGKEVLIIDEEARAEAAQAVAEDGELGVKAVSDQIAAFAKAISGNDKGKIDELKADIDKGFSEAARILGGELPEICQKTYEAVMSKLDQWSNEE